MEKVYAHRESGVEANIIGCATYELKAVGFEPEFVGKMDMYLEALDRDIKRDNENPSIGIILCPSADRSMVEYTLNRSLSPTMVAEYQCKLIPQEVMQRSLEEYCAFLQNGTAKM